MQPATIILLLLLLFYLDSSVGFVAPYHGSAAAAADIVRVHASVTTAAQNILGDNTKSDNNLPTWEGLEEELQALQPENKPEPVLTLFRDTNGWCPFCERVWMAVEAKNLQYKEILIPLQNKPDWYKKMVPTGLVPAVLFYESGNRSTLVWESSEILQALDERFPEVKLMHSSLQFQEAMELQNKLQTAAVRFVYGKKNATADELLERKQDFEAALDELDAALGDVQHNDNKLFRLGNTFSGVDAMMMPTLERWRYQLPITEGIDITQGRPHLQRWFDTLDDYAPYAHRVAGDQYSWTATAAMFLRYFGGDNVKQGIARAEAAAEALVQDFASSKYITSKDDDTPVSFALAAAEKLITNHEAVIGDATMKEPKSQQNLPRASDCETADTALRYTASILMAIAQSSSQTPLEITTSTPMPDNIADKQEAAQVLRTVATRLCVPRDMGAPSAAILRGVLAVVADRLEEEPDHAMESKVCVIINEESDWSEVSLDLARNLNVPLFSTSEWLGQSVCTSALRLVPYNYGGHVSTYAIAIDNLPPANKRRKLNKKNHRHDSSTAFFVDLCPAPNTKAGRRAKGASGSDLLLKAVQPRKGNSGSGNEGCMVFDLTAGLGQDSLILAMNGANSVYMVERNPIVFTLLEDALRRLDMIANFPLPDDATNEEKEQHALAASLAGKLSLYNADSKDWLSQFSESSSSNENVVIYLDPMFPTRQKSAAVKKGMSILHDVLETQHDVVEEDKQQEELELLRLALKVADTRVVVKRPIKAPLLGANNDDGETPPKPSYSIDGSVNRWDVYVPSTEQ